MTTPNSAGSKSPPPIDGELLPPGSGDGGRPDDPDKLSRDWIVARLMRTALTCLGELPSLQTKVIARADDNGHVTATAVQVEGPAGANAALAQLVKEQDRRDSIVQPAGSGDVSLLPHRANFEAEMAQFAETVRQRLAEQRECAERFNAERERPAGPSVRKLNTTVAMTTAVAKKAEDKARKIAKGFKPAGS